MRKRQPTLFATPVTDLMGAPALFVGAQGRVHERSTGKVVGKTQLIVTRRLTDGTFRLNGLKVHCLVHKVSAAQTVALVLCSRIAVS